MGKSTINGPFSIAFCMFTRPGNSPWIHRIHPWHPRPWNACGERWMTLGCTVQSDLGDQRDLEKSPFLIGGFNPQKNITVINQILWNGDGLFNTIYSYFTLWLFNIAMGKWPIYRWFTELNSMVIFHGELLVITRWYTNWWLSHPPEKILIRLDHHPNYWGKKMFQTTNQHLEYDIVNQL